MKKFNVKILALALVLCFGAGFLLFSQVDAEAAGSDPAAAAVTSTAAASAESADEYFTERDLEQSADLSEAVSCTLTDGQTLTITEEGVYLLSGTASEAVVVVDADGAKVQLVLDGLHVTNDGFPCLYVKNADKVFLTTVSDSSLTVTGTFRGDGETNTDGAIFSKDDLVLNGTATLTISSSDNGVVSKDDLKITGGTYVISATGHALEAKDSIRAADGTLTLTAGKDGLHAENDEDASLGYIVIEGGSFTITAADDGIHAESTVTIDGGSLSIRAAEGIESTVVTVNGGTIDISASDDGINAAQKSSAYRAAVVINGGEISIAMGAGDTDGVDSNGDLTITGGVVSVTGSSCFDVDGTVSFTGGTVYVNGQQVSTIPVQSMGGGPGGMGGAPGGWGGGPGGGGGRHG